MAKENMKRIHSVTIKRIADDSPDTSYLGEYSNSPTSKFSIDRAHDLDCIAQTYNQPTGEGLRILESAQQYLCDRMNELQELAADETVPFTLVEWYDDGDTFIVDFLDGDEEFCVGSCVSRWDNREYRYFNPSSNYFDGKDTLYPGNTLDEVIGYVRRDYERMERFNAGDWCYMGITAECEYCLATDRREKVWYKNIMQTLHSSGLWGIESDSDRDYMESIEKEQLDELRELLRGIGFSRRAINAAFRNVERKDS